MRIESACSAATATTNETALFGFATAAISVMLGACGAVADIVSPPQAAMAITRHDRAERSDMEVDLVRYGFGGLRTNDGTVLRYCVPLPSCPASFAPHHHTVPVPCCIPPRWACVAGME